MREYIVVAIIVVVFALWVIRTNTKAEPRVETMHNLVGSAR